MIYRHITCRKGEIGIHFRNLLSVLANIDNCIIKPSKDSSAGVGVRGLQVLDGVVVNYDGSLEKLLKSYRGNFIIEEKVVCCDNLRNLNPSSYIRSGCILGETEKKIR